MTAFVLVHGAWHGGWCWRHVADRLRAHGHAVTTPTLSGLGERAHLLSEAIDLETHVADIASHIRFEGLSDVVLVGHSFAGAVITGVADRSASAIRRLVYLDALVLHGGESPMRLVPEEVAAERIRLAEESSGGLSIPPPSAAVFGLSAPDEVAWVESRLTPHPLRTYLSALHLQGPIGAGLPIDYIVCRDPLYVGLKAAHRRAQDAGWTMHELATGHDAMVSAPAPTADLIEAIADA